MPCLLFISLIALIKFSTRIDAAECTDAEDQSITDAYAAAAATSACSPYSSTNILILIVPPCSATGCVAVMQDLANNIPNCTSSGISTSEKDQLLRSLDICATPAPTPASTTSSTNCTSSQAEATSTPSMRLQMTHVPVPQQLNIVQNFAQLLPNCNYELSNENTNKRQDIATQFSYCEMLDNATNISVYVDSVDNLLGSAAGATPVVPNCTTEEIDETVAFYLTVANNETCRYDSSICTYDVHVNAVCDTPCGELIQRLGVDVPRCYFDHINRRESLTSSWYQCDWIVDPSNISISFHYSEILNATGNSSVNCDPKFDSTVTSDDNSLGTSSTQGDNSAEKSHQAFVLRTAVSIVVFTWTMLF